MQINKIQAPVVANQNKNKSNQVSFGNAACADKILGNGTIGKISKLTNFDSINMPFAVMATVMIGGVIIPRIIQAQDEYDREEIMRRDFISTIVITTAQPILNKAMTKLSEMKTGFALATKPDFANKTNFQKFLDYINPVKGVRVLNSARMKANYSEIDKLENGIEQFCDFVTENGGNLKKLFSFKEGGTKEIVERIVGKDIFEAGDNKAIRDGLAKAAKEGSKDIQMLYSKFASPNNPFVIKAKSLSSMFGFLSMFLLVPALLGFAIPKVNERITKKKFLARQAEEQAKIIANNKVHQFVPKLNESLTLSNVAQASLNSKSSK